MSHSNFFQNTHTRKGKIIGFAIAVLWLVKVEFQRFFAQTLLRCFPCVVIMAEIEPQQKFQCTGMEFKAAIIVIMFTMFFSLSFFPLYLKANAFVTKQPKQCYSWGTTAIGGGTKNKCMLLLHMILPTGFIFFCRLTGKIGLLFHCGTKVVQVVVKYLCTT